jgi:hypothetical protein
MVEVEVEYGVSSVNKNASISIHPGNIKRNGNQNGASVEAREGL